MAQTVIFRYRNSDSTREWNSRWTQIVADGVYEGLLVSQTTPPSMFLNISAGAALTKEGVKITESVDLENVVEITPAHPTRRRIDLVCLYHQYLTTPTNPPGNFASYVVITGDVPPDDITPPVAPYNQLTMYHLPLAEIRLPGGATEITDDMIFNVKRTPTTKALSDEMARAFYYGWGNFAYEGWEVLDNGGLSVKVTPGSGLLCGRLNRSTTDYIINNLRPRDYLRPPNDPNTGQAYQVGVNLSLLEQPDFPTKLLIEISSPTTAVFGKIYISGTNEFGDQILNYEVNVAQAAGETKTYETGIYFGSVFLEGIDAQELVVPGHNVYINIKDKPVHRIYAVGTDLGNPSFRYELNPAYQPLCNELLLATVETDETHVIQIDNMDINPLIDYVDHLSSQCDGARTVFYAQFTPAPNTDSLWLDGLQLFRDDTTNWSLTYGKGYKLNGHQVTLGPQVPPPDSGTVLVLRYKRHA